MLIRKIVSLKLLYLVPFLFMSHLCIADDDPKIGLYVHGVERAPIVPFLYSAKKSIYIEAYQMRDKTVRHAIREALRHNIKVRILREPEPIGSHCDLFRATQGEAKHCKEERAIFYDIKSKNDGSQFYSFDKRILCKDTSKCFMHGKLIIIDNRRALISTGNFNRENLCTPELNSQKCFRDYSVIVDDAKQVEALSKAFDLDFKDAQNYRNRENSTDHTLELLKQAQITKGITIGPGSTLEILQSIENAKATVELENQKLEGDLRKVVENIAKRGVKVQVTLPSACAYGQPTATKAKEVEEQLLPLEKLGVSIRMLPSQFLTQGRIGYLHAKAIVIDHNLAWIGSTNGTYTGLNLNREFGYFFDKKEWVAKLSTFLDLDHHSLDTESWREGLNCVKDETSLHEGTSDESSGAEDDEESGHSRKRPRSSAHN